MKITAVILAAGTSSRMTAGNKLLLDYGKRTVIEQVLLNTADSNVDDVLVVTGYESDRLQDKLKNRLTERIRLVHNADYQRGRAASVKCAVRNLGEDVDAALFMVADKPGVQAVLINRAIDMFLQARPAILYVRTPGGRGHPIIFNRSLFDELLTLEGDRVGEELIAHHRDRVCELEDSADQIDINTEKDYRAVVAALAGSKPGGMT